MKRWARPIINFCSRKPLLALSIIGVISRLLVIIGFHGNISFFGDSDGYIELAQRLSHFNLEGHDGTRTPGFPMLIAIAGNHLYLMALLQAILGIITSLLWYDLICKILHRKRTAFLVALFLSTFLHILFYERAVLTESFTLFTLSLSVWYLVKCNFFYRGLQLKQAIICGLLMLLTFMVRPMFLILPLFVFVCNLYLHLRIQKMKAVFISALLLAPTVLGYLYWTNLNERNTGYKQITSFRGITTAQTTLNFVEEAPDEFADLRDRYIRKRDSLKKIDGAVAVSIWQVYGELQREEGITVAQFSQRLEPMNRHLIRNHPDRYLKQAAIAWKDFWNTSIFWNYDKFDSTIAQKGFIGIWIFIQRPLLIFLKVGFVFISFFVLIRRSILKKGKLDFLLFIILFTLGGSLGQALATYGSNSRFSFPFLPMILCVVCYYGEQLYHQKLRKS